MPMVYYGSFWTSQNLNAVSERASWSWERVHSTVHVIPSINTQQLCQLLQSQRELLAPTSQIINLGSKRPSLDACVGVCQPCQALGINCGDRVGAQHVIGTRMHRHGPRTALSACHKHPACDWPMAHTTAGMILTIFPKTQLVTAHSQWLYIMFNCVHFCNVIVSKAMHQYKNKLRESVAWAAPFMPCMQLHSHNLFHATT